MDTLILMRHAKAVREHEAPTDRARPLTERGRQDAAAAAAAMRDLGLRFDLALISPAARTRETAEVLLAAFPAAAARIDEALYMAQPEAIWRAALGGETGAVLIVGHNPGLQELAADLARQSGDRSPRAAGLSANFPTAAFAAFSVTGDVIDAAGPRLIAAWTS